MKTTLKGVVMNEEMLELALSRIAMLEQKLERYFQLLNVENELGFILKGTYILESDVEKILNGQ